MRIGNLLKFLFFCTILILSSEFLAGGVYLTDSLKIETPLSVSIDPFANFYISTRDGSIIKYDSTGRLLSVYSSLYRDKITLLESWDFHKVFAFSYNSQKLFFMDQYLSVSSELKIRNVVPGHISMATGGNNNSVWLLDDTEMSLKNLEPETGIILSTTTLQNLIISPSVQFNFIRPYQNFVFLSEENSGIMIFDNMGNYQRNLDYKGVKYFNFLKDEIYFLYAHRIVFINLYTGDKREIEISHPHAEYVLASGKKVLAFVGAYVYFYKVDNP